MPASFRLAPPVGGTGRAVRRDAGAGGASRCGRARSSTERAGGPTRPTSSMPANAPGAAPAQSWPAVPAGTPAVSTISARLGSQKNFASLRGPRRRLRRAAAMTMRATTIGATSSMRIA